MVDSSSHTKPFFLEKNTTCKDKMAIQTRDYRETSQLIASDLETMFDHDPDAIDVLLYRAELATAEVVTGLVQDVVGSLESDERAIEYADPVETRGIFLPFDFSGILAMDDGDMAGDFETPIVMLIKGDEIPKASVIQYDEYVSQTETRRVTLYVMKSEAVGQSPAIAFKYYLIPFFDDEGAFNPAVISGTITDESGDEPVPLAGVTVTFSNGGGSVVTGLDGSFSLTVPVHGWSGAATPELEGYTFTPESRSFSGVTLDQVDMDFVGAVEEEEPEEGGMAP